MLQTFHRWNGPTSIWQICWTPLFRKEQWCWQSTHFCEIILFVQPVTFLVVWRTFSYFVISSTISTCNHLWFRSVSHKILVSNLKWTVDNSCRFVRHAYYLLCLWHLLLSLVRITSSVVQQFRLSDKYRWFSWGLILILLVDVCLSLSPTGFLRTVDSLLDHLWVPHTHTKLQAFSTSLRIGRLIHLGFVSLLRIGRLIHLGFVSLC